MKLIPTLILLFLLFLAGINVFYNYCAEIPLKSVELLEEYNPQLQKINSIPKLLQYTDSIYASKEIASQDSLLYTNIIAKTIRLRFYHGWSQYTWKNNWILALLSPLHPHAMGIVKPNDLLKYSEALCSQQSIVGMIALRNKGFTYRKVGFFDTLTKSGHFTYEIKLANKWHFYDVDKEPDFDLLTKANRPSIEYLATNEPLRRKAYAKYDSSIQDDLISSYDNKHLENEFPAKNMLLLHEITKMLSYWAWLIVGLIYSIYTLWYKIGLIISNTKHK